MSRKRRMFDIDVPAVDEIPEVKLTDQQLGVRRGPMASAISENAQALRERRETENSIREENDQLAHELVRLRKAGQVAEAIPLDQIHADKLTRDRAPGTDDDLDELTASIRDIGLSNPIRVEPRVGGGYELVQGMRRLTAFRALSAETGDNAFACIPAIVQQAGMALDETYRQMVDENLVRKDISFAEMAMLALRYAEDPVNSCPDVDKAVGHLFKSASYTKRSYIRAFAGLLMRVGKSIAHPTALSRNVGVDLKRRMDADPGLVARVSSALLAAPDRTAEDEAAILKGFLKGEGKAGETLPTGKVSPAPARKPRTTFEVGQGAHVAKCAASSGRLELRCDMDFASLDRRDLERAVAAFLAELDGAGG